jgi:hypothetical protein
MFNGLKKNSIQFWFTNNESFKLFSIMPVSLSKITIYMVSGRHSRMSKYDILGAHFMDYYYGSFGPSVRNEYARAVILSKPPLEMHFQEWFAKGQLPLNMHFQDGWVNSTPQTIFTVPENRFCSSGCVSLPQSNRMNITLSE